MNNMKITAFVGSARKKHTYNAVAYLMKKLHSYGNVEYEIVSLNDYNLQLCKGCKLCLNKGEEFCPMKDDRDKLLEKIYGSNGIVFASPNYSFDVSGLMKVFIDRLGFAFHRPRFFGKAFTGIVAQGFYRGQKIIEYFNFIGRRLGFNVVEGYCFNSMEPMTSKEQEHLNSDLDKLSKKFFSTMVHKRFPTPTIFKLLIFRMSRTSIRLLLDENWIDYRYYFQKGWFDSDYFYQTRLGPLKKLLGKSFDFLFGKIYMSKAIEKQTQQA